MTIRRAKIYFNKMLAGVLERSERGYSFVYNDDYLTNQNAVPISINFPLKEKTYQSVELFPFFKGLIPEGWLFEINIRTLKIDPSNDFEVLINTTKDCIGAVSVIGEEEL